MFSNLKFENDVKTYGTQTAMGDYKASPEFENDVKTYGTQIRQKEYGIKAQFENDVKTYGTQTLRTFSQIILVV